MEKRKTTLKSIITYILLSLILTTAQGGINLRFGGHSWKKIEKKEWKLSFYVPEDEVETSIIGSYGKKEIHFTSQDKKLKIKVIVFDKDMRFKDMEDFGLRYIQEKAYNFEQVAEGHENRLQFKTYVNEGKKSKDPYIAAVVAKHERYNFSYLIMLETSQGYYKNHQKDIKFWYNHIQGE